MFSESVLKLLSQTVTSEVSGIFPAFKQKKIIQQQTRLNTTKLFIEGISCNKSVYMKRFPKIQNRTELANVFKPENPVKNSPSSSTEDSNFIN